MADEYILKSFDGGAQTTTLTAGFTSGGATLAVANGTSFPDGSSGPFVVVVDRGLATEEKFLIDTTSGTSNVTFTIQQAGYDGTSAVNHNAGATVDHCLDAYTVEQANRYVNLQDTKGSLVTHTGTTTAKIAASATNNLTLLTDSTVANGIKWAQIVEATITTSAVTTSKIADSNVTLAKLATAVQNLLVPAGTISATIKSTADTGWLLLNGASIAGADALYPSLWPIAPASWKSGTTLNLPNMANKMLEGQSTTALGASGGSNTVTIASGNLPTHVHSIDPPDTSLVIADNGLDVLYNAGSYTTGYITGVDANNDGILDGTTNTFGIAVGTATSHGHTGSVNIAAFNSADGGFANTALTITNAHLAVNYQIKAH
jgi:microcystin-dependent protein